MWHETNFISYSLREKKAKPQKTFFQQWDGVLWILAFSHLYWWLQQWLCIYHMKNSKLDDSVAFYSRVSYSPKSSFTLHRGNFSRLCVKDKPFQQSNDHIVFLYTAYALFSPLSTTINKISFLCFFAHPLLPQRLPPPPALGLVLSEIYSYVCFPKAHYVLTAGITAYMLDVTQDVWSFSLRITMNRHACYTLLCRY